MEKVLEAKNLRISFRTNNGAVKAVRNISFEINKGQTLALVGESGSGKTVTARALMGLLAGNAMVDSGEIFYDGRDLVKIPEDEFHQLRGNRVSMIFQDPFSSLNPIMRVGKQLTEAMVLNGRANQREARRDFNKRIRLLTAFVKQSKENAGASEAVSGKMAKLKQFTHRGNALERIYNAARGDITITLTAIEGVLIDMIRGDARVIARSVRQIIRSAGQCYHPYLVKKENSPLPDLLAKLGEAVDPYRKGGDSTRMKELLGQIKEVLTQAQARPVPDFFAMGYYVVYNTKAGLPETDIPQLNETMRNYMNEHFLLDFLRDIQAGIKLSHTQSVENKRAALRVINEKLPLFENQNSSIAQCRQAAKDLCQAVERSIDRIAIQKDNMAYTFRTGLTDQLQTYEQARIAAKKKKPNKKEALLVPDVDLFRENIWNLLVRIRDHYQAAVDQAHVVDFQELSRQMVMQLRDDSSRMVHRVTAKMAKSRAISLMEEVGISEAHARFQQYPFQMSGGMRQRIVIAIALAANPDILICDEPTTALDVTIQAQIMDLINSLKEKRKLTVVFITHDLGVVANMADYIAVMYAGKIVEYGTVEDIFYEPAHPYTWALLASMPDLDTAEKLESIPGTLPNMVNPPKGDAFAARNKYAMQIDFEEEPPFFELSPTHKAATWLLHPNAPKVEPPRIITERIKRMRTEVRDNG